MKRDQRVQVLCVKNIVITNDVEHCSSSCPHYIGLTNRCALFKTRKGESRLLHFDKECHKFKRCEQCFDGEIAFNQQ